MSKWQAIFRRLFLFLNPAALLLRPIQLQHLKGLSGYAKGILLDVGCGDRLYDWIFSKNVQRYIGCDLPRSLARPGGSRPDLFCSGLALPFKAGSVDTVLALQVLEHVPDPYLFLWECYRVLSPQGVMIATVPLMNALHEEPFDFFRFTKYAMKQLLDNVGFKDINIQEQGGGWLGVGFLSGYMVWDAVEKKGFLLRNSVRMISVVFLLVLRFLDKIWYCPRYTIGYTVLARK